MAIHNNFVCQQKNFVKTLDFMSYVIYSYCRTLN